jgi:hypothetical protein
VTEVPLELAVVSRAGVNITFNCFVFRRADVAA